MRTSSINEYFSSRVRLPKAIVYNHQWRHHRFCPRIPIKSPKGHVASLCWPLRDCPNGSWRHDREKRSKGRRNPSATALSAKPKPQPKRKVFGRSSKMIRWCEQKIGDINLNHLSLPLSQMKYSLFSWFVSHYRLVHNSSPNGLTNPSMIDQWGAWFCWNLILCC